MMQWWGPDAIRFMRDASEYGDYYVRLAGRLMRWLPADGHVCDAGCGLGYLAQALARRCRRVTAIDRSEAAIAELRARAPEQNLTVLCEDLFAMPPAPQFDAMTFCYFGRIEEILRLTKRHCRGTAVVIKRDCREHRFSVDASAAHCDIRPAAEAFLKERGIPFHAEKLELELGQPFRTMEDAMTFFRLYNKGGELTAQWVASRLTETGQADYPLYLPEIRKMAILVLQAGDISEEWA